jgi:hypothetical protein
MGRGNPENHPVTGGMSRHSTVGILPKVSSDLLVHRGNGWRAITKTKVLGRGRTPESDC